jgi:hypothetical protein
MQKHWRIEMAENRLARELEGRNAVERPKQWQPASTLPEPDKEPGYSYRWVRISSLNNPDAGNISSKLREGWEPVRIEEQPKYKYLASTNSQFKDSVEIAGLLLCKIPSEFMAQRKAHYSGKTTILLCVRMTHGCPYSGKNSPKRRSDAVLNFNWS